MKIQIENILKTLQIARLAVAGSDHLEQLGHFIFAGDNLITFNNRLLVFYPYKTDFKCSVQSELFYKQLQKFKTPEVEMTLDENRIKIKGSRERASLAVTTQKDVEIFNIIDPIHEEQLAIEYKEIPPEFVKAIDFCAYTASTNAADGTLCCICMSGNTVMSTDNMKATQYFLSSSMTDEELLFDSRAARELKHFNMTNFAVGKNWFHFKNDDGVIVSSRRIFGDYMDLSHVFDLEGSKMRLPKETKEILDFVSVIIAEDQEPERKTTIIVRDGLLTASVKKTRATAEKSIELAERYKDLDFEFIVNIEFLKTILDYATVMIYNLEQRKIMLKAPEFKYAIRLVPDQEVVQKEPVEPEKEEGDDENGEGDFIPF